MEKKAPQFFVDAYGRAKKKQRQKPQSKYGSNQDQSEEAKKARALSRKLRKDK